MIVALLIAGYFIFTFVLWALTQDGVTWAIFAAPMVAILAGYWGYQGHLPEARTMALLVFSVPGTLVSIGIIVGWAIIAYEERFRD